ncbi:hypothetical protein PV10_02156 [Exophiala mesophila]|uniref:JmjC domain-containing protein n=1 Tax=Exophiala mesophila TaxID=212818 RepID=A0A0D1ZKE5_EXOME|nr:uncharacterized protein PV10_02156 [Exophiala mesophila]KIV94384.1 hypothetical protein PV10_02156 [Exophiala mesophila]
MIPPTPSVIVPPDSSAQLLLRQGKPFVAFPRFSILDLQVEKDHEGNPVPFSEWLTKRLQLGQPFVIADFDKLDTWPKPGAQTGAGGFDIESLIEFSTKKNIPIRNCTTGRDLSFTLRKFADSARQSFPEFQNLYARDLQCPPQWLDVCRKLLPPELQWSGRLDLFQWLPACARSEVMMAYVGSEGSSSGFHRCFSSTVALNLLVETDDRPVVCIGTDFDSQQKYNAFMTAHGVSPHLDWLNLGMADLLKADFPLYAYDQRIGDLVVFPPATAHQVWNPSTLSAKLVWNILHPLSLEVGFQHVQAPFNRLCHPDVARTNLSLACAMRSLLQDDQHPSAALPLPPDLPLLSRLFRKMANDESIEATTTPTISLIPVQPGTVATCNFCNTAIWNRYVRCTQCADFDLCLLCYLNGRSCEHTQSYAWAELFPAEECTQILNRAREILGFQPEEPRSVDLRKTLGTAVNDLMRAKTSTTMRLCHLCRIEHQEWKGRRCDRCTAFFCYRGLFRHFDAYPSDVLRHQGMWTCPKCEEICNCRCCHFAAAYTKSEKPATKRRVKANDPRGKVMGFADNVFDQKRGRRESSTGTTATHGPLVGGSSQMAGKKRAVSSSAEAGTPALIRKVELPTPEPDLSGTRRVILSREGSEYMIDSSYTNHPTSLPTMLPSLKSFTENSEFMVSPTEERHSRVSSSPGLASMASTAVGPGRLMSKGLSGQDNTLPPILGHTTSNGVYVPQHVSNGTVHSHSHVPMLSPPKTSMLNHDAKMPTAELDASIIELETQLHNLKKYEEEFIALDLEDSRRTLAAQLIELEMQIKAKKREKSLVLIERLKREGFGSLAAVVGKEVGLGVGVEKQVD